nr:S8 family serine peptidase [Armatimonadota bacterium]
MSDFQRAARQTAPCASPQITLPLAAALLLLGGANVASAKAPALAKASVPAASASVIVTVAGDLTPAHESQLRALGAGVYRRLPLIHAVALRLPAPKLAALRALPWVTHVSPDSAVHKTDEFTVGSSGANQAYGTNPLGRPYKLTGQGVAVAVLDSGINIGRDLRTNGATVAARVSFVPGPPTVDDPCGHGTHVAGIIGGSGASSTGPRFFHTFTGIAPQARLVSVRVLNAQGQGDVSTVIAGIQWAVANKLRYNIRVLNLSLGHPVGESCQTDPLCLAAEAAWQSGITVVCAAGNAGRSQTTVDASNSDNEGYGTAYGSIESPGNDPYVITVGATKRTLLADGVTTDPNRADDKVATYSSRGPSRLDFVLKPDLVAPGNRVISLDVNHSTLENAYGATNHVPVSAYASGPVSGDSNAYYTLSGTSMAAPVVAGAAALLLQANPLLTPDTIKARLMVSADKITRPDGTSDPCTYGAGYVNIPAALSCPLTLGLPALSPVLTTDDQGNVLVEPLHITWGDTTGVSHITWGDHITWG